MHAQKKARAMRQTLLGTSCNSCDHEGESLSTYLATAFAPHKHDTRRDSYNWRICARTLTISKLQQLCLRNKASAGTRTTYITIPLSIHARIYISIYLHTSVSVCVHTSMHLCISAWATRSCNNRLDENVKADF